MPFDIIPLEPRHWNRVRAIYLEGLATGRAGFETRAPEWAEWDITHLPHSRMVAVATAEGQGERLEAPGGSPHADRDRDPASEPESRDSNGEGRIVGWIALSTVSDRQCYAGVAEVSVYVAGEAWGRGVGTLLLNEAVRTSEAAGVWTLQAAIFPENSRSVRLHSTCGFRIVGRRERIARRDGVWHDTLLMERRSRVVGRESG